MGRRKHEQFHVRTIQKTGGNSYVVTLPVDVVRDLEWQEGQKVEIQQWGDGMRIDDWEEE